MSRPAGLAIATLVLAAATGCEEPGSAADRGDPRGPAPDATARTDSVPAAILGQAPPPAGDPIRYVPGDSATVGYLAVPDGEGPFPAVVLVHEWDGLVDRVRQTADALAAEGYVALAADLYRGRTGSSREENMALVEEARADMDRVVANLDAAVAAVRARPDVTGRVAAIGWCFGGGVALSYGLDGAAHEGTAIFYGRLVTDPEVLARLDHEIYGTFAEMDGGIPPAEVERFVAALRAAGVPNDVHVYDGVDHGFWLYVDEDPEARLAPAADAWARLLAYLERALGG